VTTPLQQRRPRGADLPAHGWPPPCQEIELGLGEVVRDAQQAAAAPRWTLRRLVGWVEKTFGCTCCRETIRRALHRLRLSLKKVRKLLGRADPRQREAFIAQVRNLLAGARHDRHRLVYLDEAHIHQDADLGHGWSARGQRFWVASRSPRLADRLSFYGLYLYNEGKVRLWPYARANGENIQRRSCRSIPASASSCTTLGAEARSSSAPLSQP
jgi:transposase